MPVLRAAFLGTGGIARCHADRLRRLGDVEITAACGTSRAKAADFLGGAGTAYEDVDAMLAHARIDALWVCLPPAANQGQVEAAAAKGIHCFLEKPIARDVARGRSIAAAIAKAGVISQVGHHMRFTGPARALRRAIDDGSAGRPTLLQGCFFCNHLHSAWWRDAAISGGQLFEQAIHVYDFACWMLGRPVAVAATMANICHQDVTGYTGEDTSAAMVRFAGGGAASIAGSNCAVRGEWWARWTMVCDRLTAVFSEPAKAEFIASGDGGVARTTPEAGEDPYLAINRDFVDAVRAGRPASVPVADGLRGLELVAAAVESARDGGRCITVGGAP